MKRTIYNRANILKSALILVFIMMSTALFAQEITDCGALLDTEPYFVKHAVLPTDSMLLHDIQILKHCGNFDQVDSELLKGSVLNALMKNEVSEGKPATYRTIITFVSNFRKTKEYQEFKAGVLLYKELENKKVNPANWGRDRALFIKLGFTVSDLDDFKEYISTADHKDMTYKQAYLQYIKEIEALGTKSK